MPTARSSATTPPGRAGAVRMPLPLARVVGRVFGPCRRYRPELTRYLADLAAQYGLPYRPEDFAQLDRTTFTEMAQALLTELEPLGGPVDLVVLAHSTRDAEPGWPACVLTRTLPGAPLAFAVADQGMAAPFTALRIAAEYARADDLGRVLVLVLDQHTVVYDQRLPAGVPMPSQDGAVALVFEWAGGLAEASLYQVVDAAPSGVARLWDYLVGDRSVIVLAGSGVAPEHLPAGVEVVPAQDGLPCTGLWLSLVSRLDGWPAAGPDRIALVEYDRSLRYLNACVLQQPGRI